MAQLNLLGKIGRAFLVVLNVFFLILGICLFVGGIILLMNSGPAQDNVSALMNNIQIGTTFTLGSLVRIIGGILIVVGIFSFIVSVLGILGATKHKKYTLILYAAILTICIILELVVVGSFFQMKGDLNSTMKRKMLELLVPYEGNTGNALTSAWNWLFLSFDCCGVNPIIQTNDFVYTSWWRSLMRGNDQIPGYCCAGATADTAVSNARQACTIAPTPINSYIATGCFDAINNVMTAYSTTFIVMGIISLLVEVAAVIFACLMAAQLFKGGEDGMNPKRGSP